MLDSQYIVLIVLLGIPVFYFVLVGLVSSFLIEKAPSLSPITGKHGLITGGSSGIGLATAKVLVKQGVNVTLIARDKKKLDEAVSNLRQFAAPSVRIVGISADVSSATAIKSAINRSIEEMGNIHIFIASAGVSTAQYFESTPLATFENLIQVNYLGIVYALQSILPHMRTQKIKGRIILISSLAGLSGIFGYSAYTPTKFAIRGLAEVLHMEYAHFGIFFTVVYPPDVNTPMLTNENQTKPKETFLISEGPGLFSAETIATSIVNSIHNWTFTVTNGFDGTLLGWLTSGTSPASSVIVSLIESGFLGLIRFVSIGYRFAYMGIVKKVHRERMEGKVAGIAEDEKQS